MDPQGETEDNSRQRRGRRGGKNRKGKHTSSSTYESIRNMEDNPAIPLATNKAQPLTSPSRMKDSNTKEDIIRHSSRTCNPQSSPHGSDELVSDLVCILVKHGGSVQVNVLRKSHRRLYADMLKLSTDNTVNGFIQNYSHLLTGSPDNASVLTLSFNLEICKVHGSSGGKCETNCKCLHICKFQMMNRCSRGRNCIFGHNLRSNHNNSVLKFHKMEKLSNQQIRELLSSLNNRKGLTLPGICSFYNSNIGCQRSRKCSFLHLCKYFIRGNCRFGEEKCCFSHDVSEDQPRRILRRYGLNGTTIEDLQRLMVAEYPSSSDEDYLYTSDEQCSESASSNEFERQEAKSFSIYDQLYKKWGSSDQSNRFEDTSDSSNEGQEFDALANQEEMRVPFENESYALDRLRTSGEKIHCLTAWTSEPLCESRHQALDFGLHIDEERNDPRERNSPLIGNDVLQMTRSAPSVAHCWQVSTRTDRRTVELSVRDHQELESLYHTYLRAKQPTIRLNGQNMSIDFEAMSGRRKTEKGTEEFIIKRYHSANISD